MGIRIRAFDRKLLIFTSWKITYSFVKNCHMFYLFPKPQNWIELAVYHGYFRT
jgi:hypothetical protein